MCFPGPKADSYESPNIEAEAAEPFPTGSLAVGDAILEAEIVFPTSEEVGHPPTGPKTARLAPTFRFKEDGALVSRHFLICWFVS
jgi:hypothetical protein